MLQPEPIGFRASCGREAMILASIGTFLKNFGHDNDKPCQTGTLSAINLIDTLITAGYKKMEPAEGFAKTVPTLIVPLWGFGCRSSVRAPGENMWADENGHEQQTK